MFINASISVGGVSSVQLIADPENNLMGFLLEVLQGCVPIANPGNSFRIFDVILYSKFRYIRNIFIQTNKLTRNSRLKSPGTPKICLKWVSMAMGGNNNQTGWPWHQFAGALREDNSRWWSLLLFWGYQVLSGVLQFLTGEREYRSKATWWWESAERVDRGMEQWDAFFMWRSTALCNIVELRSAELSTSKR